ncbi:hypothetical protein [Aeromonas veronii]|uniref:hypothetical protein n=1 Tax=Aeromonas veronii TaxID=654 RepID=UPI003D1F3EB4
MDVKCYVSNVIFKYSNSDIRTIPIIFKSFGYEIEWFQREGYNKPFSNDCRYSFVESSVAIVRNVVDIQHLELSMMKLAWMLSFALNAQVSFYSYRDITNEIPSCGKQWSVSGVYSASPSPINPADSQSLVNYLECCWYGFDHVYETRNIPVIIDYFTQPEAKQLPLEIKLSLSYILLEALKYSYAVNDGYPFIKGEFKYKTNLKKDICARELIIRMFDSVNLKFDDDLLEERNFLIHQGISNKEPRDMHLLYIKLREAISEYMLRIFGYK